MPKTGTANLPLHWGKCPPWLFAKMVKLTRALSEVAVYEYGPDEFIRKLAEPFFFQALGCVLGFDWHSSGLTTTVCGAFKEALRGAERDLGLFVAGGKGGTSRKTPLEIENFVARFVPSQNAKKLVYASKMSAKVDSAALQDGYQLYHHSFIFTATGSWTVIQQGMNTEARWARRYHWSSKSLESFTCEPHLGICSEQKGTALNMVASESNKARDLTTEIATASPNEAARDLKKLKELNMPGRHQLFLQHLSTNHIEKVLLTTYEKQPTNFEELLSLKGVGPQAIRALALISELVYGTEASYRDPATFSFAHGGKDGYPYPVNKETYQNSITTLEKAIKEAKLGRSERLEAFRKLARYTSNIN